MSLADRLFSLYQMVGKVIYYDYNGTDIREIFGGHEFLLVRNPVVRPDSALTQPAIYVDENNVIQEVYLPGCLVRGIKELHDRYGGSGLEAFKIVIGQLERQITFDTINKYSKD